MLQLTIDKLNCTNLFETDWSGMAEFAIDDVDLFQLIWKGINSSADGQYRADPSKQPPRGIENETVILLSTTGERVVLRKFPVDSVFFINEVGVF